MNLRLIFRPWLLGLALVLPAPLWAQQDAGIILRVGRVRACVQTNRETASPDPQSAYCFFAVGQPVDGFSTIDSATIRPPGGNPMTMPPLREFPGVNALLDCGNVEAEIDADYPGGTYEFVVDYTYFGILPDTFSDTVRLDSNRYPNTPLFLGIDPSRPVSSICDLPLSWTSFVDGAEGDGMLLQIFRTTNFITGEGQVAFQMAVSVTNPSPRVVIPANTLLPDQRYDALLTFDRVFESKFVRHDVAGLELFDLYVLLESTYTKTTRMPFRTSGGPCLTVTGNSPFRFRFPATAGRSYEIQASSNLVDWLTVLTTNASSSQIIYEDAQSAVVPSRFFRTVSP